MIITKLTTLSVGPTKVIHRVNKILQILFETVKNILMWLLWSGPTQEASKTERNGNLHFFPCLPQNNNSLYSSSYFSRSLQNSFVCNLTFCYNIPDTVAQSSELTTRQSFCLFWLDACKFWLDAGKFVACLVPPWQPWFKSAILGKSWGKLHVSLLECTWYFIFGLQSLQFRVYVGLWDKRQLGCMEPLKH